MKEIEKLGFKEASSGYGIYYINKHEPKLKINVSWLTIKMETCPELRELINIKFEYVY